MRRLPRRRGFVNRFRIEYQPVNLRDLERFDDGADITNDILKEAGLIDSAKKPVKILASGEITRKLHVRLERLSLTAKENIEAAAGPAEEPTERNARSERRGAAQRKRLNNQHAHCAAARHTNARRLPNKAIGVRDGAGGAQQPLPRSKGRKTSAPKGVEVVV